MSQSESRKESWIDCLLAIEDAGIPKQRIPESSILLAFLLAVKREGEPDEPFSLSELFVEELKKLLAADKPPSTQDIISKAQASIDELNEIGTSNATKKAMLLQYPLMMLQAKLRRDVRNN